MRMIMLATSKVVKRKIYRVTIDKIDHRAGKRMIAECGGIEILQKAGVYEETTRPVFRCEHAESLPYGQPAMLSPAGTSACDSH